MSNTALVAIYTPFVLIAAIVFILEIIRYAKTRGSVLFLCMIFSVIAWNVSMLHVALVEDIYTGTFLWNVAIVFVSLATTIQFLIVYGTIRPEYKMPRRLVALFFIMPLLNAVVALSPLAPLMREVELVSAYPFFILQTVRGPWFWVHTAYSYALAVSTIWALVRGRMRKPKFYRLSSNLMTVGVIVTLFGNLITLSGITPFGVDATAFAAAIALVFLHLALSTSEDRGLFSRYARSKVFSYMEDYVLVLGEKGYVADFNPSAKRWFSSLGIDLRTCTLDSVLDILTEKGATISESPEEEKGRDIFFIDDGFPLVLNMRIHNMVDEKRYRHGYIAFFSNVTQNRALLNRLEKDAGVDSLTGLPNRIAYDGAKVRYGNPEHLPLGVIVCDVNGLKETNDSLGHKYGDMMLQKVAEVIEGARAKPHFAARIGGDEFILLLSQTDTECANKLIAQIKQSLADYDNLPFRLSMAMGAAVKRSADEPLEDIVALADRLMYQDKKQMKEQDI